jgi:D-3-phosphoglycerate dehydrogenase / 2-oxoglutarate reductase
MALPKVGVTQNRSYPVRLDVVERVLAGVAEVVPIEVGGRGLAGDDLVPRLRGFQAVIVRPGSLSAADLKALPELRHVAVHGVGFDRVDVDAAAALGIVVTNAAGTNAKSVAELTIAMAVALVRRFVRMDAEIRAGRWTESRWIGTELAGKRLGILGVGNVGSRVASRALAFEMEVAAYDPAYSPAQLAERGILGLGAEEVVATADLLTVHVPLDSTTRHLVSAAALASMKPGAYLLNLSRGPVVDERALLEALRSGRLAGAALDVRELEPPDLADEIGGLPNVIQTPHIGGSTVEAAARMAEACARDVAAVLRGEAPEHPVTSAASAPAAG